MHMQVIEEMKTNSNKIDPGQGKRIKKWRLKEGWKVKDLE